MNTQVKSPGRKSRGDRKKAIELLRTTELSTRDISDKTGVPQGSISRLRKQISEEKKKKKGNSHAAISCEIAKLLAQKWGTVPNKVMSAAWDLTKSGVTPETFPKYWEEHMQKKDNHTLADRIWIIDPSDDDTSDPEKAAKDSVKKIMQDLPNITVEEEEETVEKRISFNNNEKSNTKFEFILAVEDKKITKEEVLERLDKIKAIIENTDVQPFNLKVTIENRGE